MRRTWAALALAILVVSAVVAVLPLAGGQAGGGPHAINVVSADDDGCSGDKLSDADMRVIVRLDGAEVLATQKAQDEQQPLFAKVVSGIDASGGVTVTIEAEEAEPGGGAFGLGTVWESCDTDPGPGRSFAFAWHGEERVVTTRGDESDAAEVVVVFGSGAPAAPTLAIQPGASSADVSWAAPPGADGHRLTWGDAGDVIASLGPAATSHRVGGLCENTDYAVRLVRDQAPWHVGSGDTSFRTLNGVPVAPRVLSADVAADGSGWTVAAELPSHRDLERVEVHHSSDPAFQPGTATLVQTNTSVVWSYEARFTVASSVTAGYVRLRAVDQGGLSAVSQPFLLGAAHLAPQPAPACDGGWDQSNGLPGTTGALDDEGAETPELDAGTAGPVGSMADPDVEDGGREERSPENASPAFDPLEHPVALVIAIGAVALFLGVAVRLAGRRR